MDQIGYLKDLFEQRISQIARQVQAFFDEINGDEIYSAMRENSLSQEFASQRAKELFEEIIGGEKETTILRLQEELAQRRAECNKFEKIIRELEDKLRFEESDKERSLRIAHDLKAELGESEAVLEDRLKRKDIEWLQKIEETSRMQSRKFDEERLQLEDQVRNAIKEIENLNLQKQRDLSRIRELDDEINKMKMAVENAEKREQQWKSSARAVEDNRASIQAKLEFLIDENRDLQDKLENTENEKQKILAHFRAYQDKYEEVSSSSHKALQEIVEKARTKSRKLKQKIKEQRGKLQDFQNEMKKAIEKIESLKIENETLVANEEKLRRSLEDSEKKYRELDISIKKREIELKSQYDRQFLQLQSQFNSDLQQKTAEFEREIQSEIELRNEKEKELRATIQNKAKEVERDHIMKTAHQSIIEEKERTINKIHQNRIEALTSEFEQKISEFKEEVSQLKKENAGLNELLSNSKALEAQAQEELSNKTEKMLSEIKIKTNTIRDLENEKLDLLNKLDTAGELLEDLKDSKNEEASLRFKYETENSNLKGRLNELEDQNTYLKRQIKKYQDEQEYVKNEMVEKKFLVQEKEKSFQLETEIDKAHKNIVKLENQVDSLERSLEELSNQHSEAKNRIRESEDFTRTLSTDIDAKERKNREIIASLEQDNYELKKLASARKLEIEKAKDELKNFEALFIETRQKVNDSFEKIKRSARYSIQGLRTDLSNIKLALEYEVSSFMDSTQSMIQEIAIKLIEKEVSDKRKIDYKIAEISEEMKKQWKSKLSKIEENLLREELTWWDDADMDGIRRAAKSLIDKKKYSDNEVLKCNDYSKKLQGQVDNLNKQNQKLHLRLQANSEAFDQLQREVADESTKIKYNSQNLLRKSTQELQTKYEQEIEKLREEVKQKGKEKNELETRLKRKFMEEMEKVKNQYEGRIKGYKEELDNEQERVERLNNQLQGADKEGVSMKQRLLDEIQSLEIRVQELEGFLEQERTQKDQLAKQRITELQELTEKIKVLRSEIAEKEDKLDMYIKENRNLRAEISSIIDARKSVFSAEF
ncbi:unnamed protein product [Blepharisma stoltei]|uniref:Uncharacterized protein n=1 Tax=Blepharisma stoltei TaxID=1481888 RepID=A0AAU9J563_9CILI|nr:unnamed protein product [Blepharisma stoltei]